MKFNFSISAANKPIRSFLLLFATHSMESISCSINSIPTVRIAKYTAFGKNLHLFTYSSCNGKQAATSECLMWVKVAYMLKIHIILIINKTFFFSIQASQLRSM